MLHEQGQGEVSESCSSISPRVAAGSPEYDWINVVVRSLLWHYTLVCCVSLCFPSPSPCLLMSVYLETFKKAQYRREHWYGGEKALWSGA